MHQLESVAPDYGRADQQYQSHFLDLAERVLGLCMSSHDQLCEMAVEILFSMMLAEHESTGRFARVETQIFDQLDTLVRSANRQNSLRLQDPADSEDSKS